MIYPEEFLDQLSKPYATTLSSLIGFIDSLSIDQTKFIRAFDYDLKHDIMTVLLHGRGNGEYYDDENGNRSFAQNLDDQDHSVVYFEQYLWGSEINVRGQYGFTWNEETDCFDDFGDYEEKNIEYNFPAIGKLLDFLNHIKRT